MGWPLLDKEMKDLLSLIMLFSFLLFSLLFHEKSGFDKFTFVMFIGFGTCQYYYYYFLCIGNVHTFFIKKVKGKVILFLKINIKILNLGCYDGENKRK